MPKLSCLIAAEPNLAPGLKLVVESNGAPNNTIFASSYSLSQPINPAVELGTHGAFCFVVLFQLGRELGGLDIAPEYHAIERFDALDKETLDYLFGAEKEDYATSQSEYHAPPPIVDVHKPTHHHTRGHAQQCDDSHDKRCALNSFYLHKEKGLVFVILAKLLKTYDVSNKITTFVVAFVRKRHVWPRSLMDKMRDSGSCAGGSIPPGATTRSSLNGEIR